MTATQIERKVFEIIAEQGSLESPRAQITRADTVQSLSLDSLDEMEILMEIEDEFQLEIPDEVTQEKFKTVGDVIDYVIAQNGIEPPKESGPGLFLAPAPSVSDRLQMYTIYDNPADYPGKFVVRRWVATHPPTPDVEPFAICDSLAEARAALPGGLDPLKRDPSDDAVIVETWI